jgi:U3 small nucleolar ribonucleoprotein component
MDPKNVEKLLASEKDWKQKGEVKASNRPVDSLLMADVYFEIRLINVPVTKDENVEIYKYITQRYREKTFDNYEFKEIKIKVKEEVYDTELLETNKQIFELYEKIEQSIRAMTDYGFRS